jgi:hypothetical protein
VLGRPQRERLMKRRSPVIPHNKRSVSMCNAAITGGKHRDVLPTPWGPPIPVTRQDILAKRSNTGCPKTYGGSNRASGMPPLALTPVPSSSTPVKSTIFARGDVDEACKPPIIPLSRSYWNQNPAQSSFTSFFGARVPLGSLEGFRNTGNTCYLNSVLSALLHLPPFVRALQHSELDLLCSAGTRKPSRTVTLAVLSQIVDLTDDVDGDLESDVAAALRTGSSVPAPIFKALRRILTKRLSGGVTDVINPVDFKEVRLVAVSPRKLRVKLVLGIFWGWCSGFLWAQAVASAAHKFDTGRQEDAHEFLLYCLAEVSCCDLFCVCCAFLYVICWRSWNPSCPTWSGNPPRTQRFPPSWMPPALQIYLRLLMTMMISTSWISVQTRKVLSHLVPLRQPQFLSMKSSHRLCN